MTANSKIKLLLYVLLVVSCFEQCKPKVNTGATGKTYVASQIEPVTATRFDTIIQVLKSKGELTKTDVLSLGVIDSTYASAATETSYCDTTVQRNDNIFYSIIKLSEEGGNCSRSFIVTIDEKNKKAIASAYLMPDCDIDYSWDSYDLFDYKVISKDTVQLIKTTIFQKKNRTSDDEEENIDHKQTEKSYFIIQSSGQIETKK